MATKLLEDLKQKITAFELEPSQGGCFELAVNGDVVYSKLETGEFPDENAMLKEVRSRAS